MRRTARFVIFTCLLQLTVFSVPAVAWPPPCPSCYYWNGSSCIKYGNCWGGCGSCKSCVSCYCKCTSECCSDSDCGPCQECDNCHCDDICVACQECVEDNCISCGALGKVCCDSWCEEPCEEEDNETSCSSANNQDCIACVGWIGDCSDHTTEIYTNNTTYSCSGGCAGDCHQVQGPVCSRTYKCRLTIRYTFAECSCGGEIPGPLDCYAQQVHPWQCDKCGPDYDQPVGSPNYAECWKCP